MTRDEEVEREVEAYMGSRRGGSINAWQAEQSFKDGVQWADSTSPYKKALERAVDCLKEVYCCKRNSPEARLEGCSNLKNIKKTLNDIQKILDGKGRG